MHNEFWQILEDYNLMWGHAASICGVSPMEILQWFKNGVPEGRVEQLQAGIGRMHQPVNLEDLGL